MTTPQRTTANYLQLARGASYPRETFDGNVTVQMYCPTKPPTPGVSPVRGFVIDPTGRVTNEQGETIDLDTL